MNSAFATNASANVATSFPELEEKFAGISSHATVLGYMVLSRSAPVTLIRNSGTIFEGERGRNYAASVAKMVDAVQGFLEDVNEDGADKVSVNQLPNIFFTPYFVAKDEVKFMRIRSERHELMITPREWHRYGSWATFSRTWCIRRTIPACCTTQSEQFECCLSSLKRFTIPPLDIGSSD